MKIENMRRWSAALRSGGYEQTTGTMCAVDPDGAKSYCCLGVACEEAIRGGAPVSRAERRLPVTDRLVVAYDGDAGTLPESVAVWLFDDYDNDPLLLVGDGGYNVASYLNDHVRASFAEIADAVDATVAEYERMRARGGWAR